MQNYDVILTRGYAQIDHLRSCRLGECITLGEVPHISLTNSMLLIVSLAYAHTSSQTTP